MNPTDKLNRLWQPRAVHPDAPSVQEHYAAMERRFRAKADRHYHELNHAGQWTVSLALTALRRESR